MTRVMLDETLRAKLNNLADQLEVCDESGRVVGFFYPVAELDHALYHTVQSPNTHEDLQRFRQQRTGRPLAEILERLNKT